MKPILRFVAYVLITGSISCISCSKEPVNGTFYSYPLPQPPQPPQPPQSPRSPLPPFSPIQDSLSGREFLYPNLTWQTWGDPYFEIEIPNSHLFLNRGIEVSIDSSSTWVNVAFYTVEFGLGALPFPVNNGYIYDNNYFDSVFLFAIGSNNSQLIGTTISVKIKIL